MPLDRLCAGGMRFGAMGPSGAGAGSGARAVMTLFASTLAGGRLSRNGFMPAALQKTCHDQNAGVTRPWRRAR